jgi:ACR3 family arsenite transporter
LSLRSRPWWEIGLGAPLTAALHYLARHARFVLLAGLAAGIAVPELAGFMSGYLKAIIAVLLFLTALRIGPRQAVGSMSDLRQSLAGVAIFQVLLPITLALAFRISGFSGALANALVLMTAAAPLAGSPNLALMTGNDPAPALRQLIVGTALVPLTVLPVFLVYPIVGDIGAVLASAARLIALIAGATGLAFLVRARWLKEPSPSELTSMDGSSALLMALAVIALMSAIAPAFANAPSHLAANLIAAFAVNFGLQLAVYMIMPWLGVSRERVAFAIAAGNRNVMLFLAVLPASAVEPLMLFVACAQIPIYLTPLLLGPLYRPPSRATAAPPGRDP